MENGVGSLTEMGSSAGEPPNVHVVAVIFSKQPRTREGWKRATKGAFDSVPGWTDFATSIVDLPTPEAGQGDAASNGDEGRIYNVKARISTSSGAAGLTLEQCRVLREIAGVREFENSADAEVIFQPFDLYLLHKTPGLAVFDMDSTLIQQEVIDELARSVGRYEQVAKVTEAAMRGELNFEESLRERVAQLKGVSTDIWELLKKDVITFTPGATELVKALKQLGWKTAVLSGGFTPLAYWVRDTLGLDYAFANYLEVDESTSTLSGRVLPGTTIVGATVKRDLLVKLATENDIPLSHTIAVGDGSNDLPMMHAAGFGIAFNAKPKVQEAAPARLNSGSLLDIMYVLGLST